MREKVCQLLLAYLWGQLRSFFLYNHRPIHSDTSYSPLHVHILFNKPLTGTRTTSGFIEVKARSNNLSAPKLHISATKYLENNLKTIFKFLPTHTLSGACTEWDESISMSF